MTEKKTRSVRTRCIGYAFAFLLIGGVPPGIAQTSRYDALVAQANSDLTAGNGSRALEESRAAMAADPSKWQGHVVAAGALQLLKRNHEATDEYLKALELAPDNRKAAIRDLMEKNVHAESSPAKPEETVSQAEIVLWKTVENSTNPDDFRAYLSTYPKGAFAPLARQRLENSDILAFAATALQDGSDSEVIRQGTEFTAKYPDSPRREDIEASVATAHYNIGVALYNQGHVNEAITEYREAIRLNPNKASAHYGVGNALYAQSRLDKAIAEYREAIRLNPNFSDAHVNLGIALNLQSHSDEAIGEYREAIRLNTNDSDAHFDLGNALSLQSHWDEAIAEYRDAIRLNPTFARALSNLGLDLLEQGHRDEAVEDLKRAYAITPTDDWVRSNYQKFVNPPLSSVSAPK